MKRREKENNIPTKNAVKRKSNSYNKQQMKLEIKIKKKKKNQTRSAQENIEINTIKITSILHR